MASTPHQVLFEFPRGTSPFPERGTALRPVRLGPRLVEHTAAVRRVFSTAGTLAW